MKQEKQFLIELRKHFRLNIYEVKIWTSLLSRGIASAGELADISGVPRSRCYDVLESLEKKGFIIMKLGKPIKYLAVKPEIILERVKNNIQNEADVITTQMNNIRETAEFRELELLHKSGIQHVDISSVSKSIIGRTAINRFLKEMAARAKSDLVIVASGQHSDRCVKLLKNHMPNFAKKGVKARLYCPFSRNMVRKLQNVQHFDYNPNSTFITTDGREMAFMVSTDSVAADYEVAIWIDSPFFVNAVNALFEGSLK
jgi:sugar-specific transcriptional regulator TrmB